MKPLRVLPWVAVVALCLSACSQGDQEKSPPTSSAVSKPCVASLAGEGPDPAPVPAPSTIAIPVINGEAVPLPTDVKYPGITPKLCEHTDEAAKVVAVNYIQAFIYAGATWDFGAAKFIAAPRMDAFLEEMIAASVGNTYGVSALPAPANLTLEYTGPDKVEVAWRQSDFERSDVYLEEKKVEVVKFPPSENEVSLHWTGTQWEVEYVNG